MARKPDPTRRGMPPFPTTLTAAADEPVSAQRSLAEIIAGGDWDEAKHPRDERGKFTEGGGGAGGGGGAPRPNAPEYQPHPGPSRSEHQKQYDALEQAREEKAREGQPGRRVGGPQETGGAFTKGQRVNTPHGPGTVAYQRMKGPDYRSAESVSVVLDSKRDQPNYTGTTMPAHQVTPGETPSGTKLYDAGPGKPSVSVPENEPASGAKTYHSRAGKLTVQEVAGHRNGIGGEPFHVVRFTAPNDDGPGTRSMVGIVFPGKGNVAVLDVNETARGNIAFAQGNSWRGDNYEDALRKAVKDSGE